MVFKVFFIALKTTRFHQSKAYNSLFVQSHKVNFIAILVYVDDVVLAKIARSSKGIPLSQRKYALEILDDAGFLVARPLRFPMEQNLALTQSDGELLKDPSSYKRLVERLIYLTITRLDIIYVIHVLSIFMEKPCTPHLEATHRVLRYLKQTPGQGILLSSTSTLQLNAFCDIDWARWKDKRRSVTGYCIFY
ncbi:uncharacterized mitochondrial protein AtMg00810-like [Aristolochia californica]|uniref:uncharacterized mitochondrial protein AtMg00810-like n=1 Tax=Aristolochia californica TaxID=171875 RepID=UPI0035DDDF83